MGRDPRHPYCLHWCYPDRRIGIQKSARCSPLSRGGSVAGAMDQSVCGGGAGSPVLAPPAQMYPRVCKKLPSVQGTGEVL